MRLQVGQVGYVHGLRDLLEEHAVFEFEVIESTERHRGILENARMEVCTGLNSWAGAESSSRET